MDDFADKKALRKKILAIRKAMPANEVREKSDIICEKIMELKEYQNADTVLAYMSANNEVCLDIIISNSIKEGKQVFLPVTYKEGKMEFKSFGGDDSELTLSTFGIKEPLSGEIFDEKKLFFRDRKQIIIIMPGVLFDERKNRIGYGGGYYDRFLSRIDNAADRENAFNGITKIAAAYEMQVVSFFDPDEFDYKPDRIVTEKRII